MFTFQDSRTRRAAGRVAALWATAVMCGAGALVSNAQPAPPNDLLANAQVILGVSGMAKGTNLQATVEAGEPAPATGVAAQSTIWFVWTAPVNGTFDFNTRNSTDPYGVEMDTTLGIYTLVAGRPLGVANLAKVTGNDDDPSGGTISRVDFNASLGTTYYIQVGSKPGANQGTVQLNWGSSLVAGGFGFSASLYPMSSLENWIPDDDANGSISPSLEYKGFSQWVQGVANARITVTRSGGYTGKCQVTLNLGAGSYTNIYSTNLFITNIFITNYNSNGIIIGFTNIYLTNVASSNLFADGIGVLPQPILNDGMWMLTNTNGIFSVLTFTNLPLPGLGFTNFFTNWPCLQTTQSLLVPNNDGSSNYYVTNLNCISNSVKVVVPAAIGGAFEPFAPFTHTLFFDDYQMSVDDFVQIYPMLNLTRDGGQRPDGVNVEDFPTPGPEETGLYSVPGLNSLAVLTLSNLILDPQENPDIVPPTISQTNSYLNILNYWGNSTPLFSNPPPGYVEINFERYTYRCDRDCGTASVYVQRSVRGAPASHTVHYTIDSKHVAVTGTAYDDNKFATVADSDYAVPSRGQVFYDFMDPTNSAWVYPCGMLTFPANDLSPQIIHIPIINTGAVEFDEDIELQLFFDLPGEAQANATAQPPAYLGNINRARLTIEYNNLMTNWMPVQPGGAVDRSYNPERQNNSVPPYSLEPGANSFVNAVAIDSTGMAVIGGGFDSYNAAPVNYIARIQTNGLMDANFVSGLGRGPDDYVNAIAIDAAGRIVLGGNFSSVNGTSAFHIARLLPSGALDTSFATGYGFNGSVYALAIDLNSNIVVGGDFTSFNTTNCNHIARLLPSGALDTSFVPSSGRPGSLGTDQDVLAVALDTVGNVILGGSFTQVNGTNWNHIARLQPNGALDTTFSPGFGADGDVMALAIQPDNSIILGGAFQNFNLISRSSIARLMPSGTLDTGFLPGTGFNDIVYSLALQPDGNILVGGQFTMYNGTRRVGMARLLGGGIGPFAGEGGWLDTTFMDTSYNQFAGLINHYYNTNVYDSMDYPASFQERNSVLAMGLQIDGNVVIGGSFLQVGGGFTRDDVRIRMNEARIIGPATPGPEEGGIGNCPGNIGMTQNPYSVGDTAELIFITLDRVNGSLGPLQVTLGTNTLPASSTSATGADFGLEGTGVGLTVSSYEAVAGTQPDAFGWRASDGRYGNNVMTQPSDNLKARLYLNIFNDPSAAPIIYANLNLLNLTGTGLMSLGGVPIPFNPGLGQYSSGLDIINNNFPPAIGGFGATNYNVLEDAGTLSITLLRTNGNQNAASAKLIAQDMTAHSGGSTPDYALTSSAVTFRSGHSYSDPVNITIYNHSTQQSNKRFGLYLANPVNLVFDTTVPPLLSSNTVVQIIDDHFKPGNLSFGSPTYSVLKPGVAAIPVIRTGAAYGQVSVSCMTSNGTGVSGVNYVAMTTNLQWLDKDTTNKIVYVQTLQDNTVEGPKTVNLSLFNPQVSGNANPLTNAMLLTSPSNAVLTIQDTDSYGTLNFLVPNFSVFQNAGQALITVTRSGGTMGSVSVNYATYPLTNTPLPFLEAINGINYSATNGVLTFPAGVSSASFAVPVFNTPSEANIADRLVGLQIFSASPTNIAAQFPKTATLTILDPQLHINSAGAVDQTTQNGIGFNNPVTSLALQPDSSLLAGGLFTSFNGFPYDYVGRLLATGNFDTGFLAYPLTGPNSNVWQVLSQAPSAGLPVGNVMIVGDFTQVNQINSARVARLNLDGSLDVSFNPGAGADSTVYAISQMLLAASPTDPTLAPYFVIGGAFANYGGAPAGGVARLTPGGQIDPNFNIGPGTTGSNANVYAVAITPANQIIVGGDFTSFNNQAHHHLVRLNVDGTLDTNFALFDGISSDINGSVRAIAVQPDGRILIGGLFTSVNSGSASFIARLNADGTTDTNFNIGQGCNNSVEALALDDQLRILVGGTFTRASGVTRSGITRLNPDGTVDPSINFGFGANGYVDTIVLETNGEIDVGGGFSTFNDIPENNFARLYGGANAGNGSVQFYQQTYGVLQSGTNAEIGIQRIGGTFGSPSVTAIFMTSDQTAQSGRDYTGVTNTVTFPFGETFQTVQVSVSNTLTVGPDLTVGLLLTNPAANSEAIGPLVSATLIITNINAGVEFSASGYRQSADAGTIAIPIERVGNPNSTAYVTVYTGTNGTAAPFINYVPTTYQVQFNPQEMTKYVLIQVLNSPTTFEDTTVDLEMEGASNAVEVAPSSALLTIKSVLNGPGYLSFSQSAYTVSEGATNAVITVVRTNGNYGTVSVTMTTSDGTAKAGINYSNATTTLTIQDGYSSATNNIPIIQLTNAQPNTTVNLTLSNPQNGAILSSPSQAVLTIMDDIPAFDFNSPNYFVGEGGLVTLTVLRLGPATATNYVNYTTYSPANASESIGLAVPNVDYVPTSGTLTFLPGVMLQTIPVTTLQGTNVYAGASFQVQLQSVDTQIASPGTATVDIIGDVSGVAFATSNYYVGENGSNITITVNRINPGTGNMTVDYATSDNTAISGVDYVGTAKGTLTILSGQPSATINVQILNPNLVESNKTFSITLTNATANASVISPATTVVTITNVYVGVGFASATASVSECAPSAAIPVVLTGLTNAAVQVQYATADGSGKAGVNYFETHGTLTFQPGQTVSNIYVTPINNNTPGPDHTVIINLTLSTNTNSPVPPSTGGVELMTPSTEILTLQNNCNGADILTAGTAFVTGNIQPATGVLYPNETVTVLLGLRNINGGDTSPSFTATLVASNGISSNGLANPAFTQTYGVLHQNGPVVFEPYTFVVNGTNGQNITATLNLQDGARILPSVAFGFTVGGSTVTSNSANVLFLPEIGAGPTTATNSAAPGYGYPSLINMSGIPGFVTKAAVTLSNFGHSFPSDVDIVLAGPNGSNSILMSHCGIGTPVTNLTLTFDAASSVHVPLGSKLTNGTYLPTTNGGTPLMPHLPAISSNVVVPVSVPQSPYPYGANLSTLTGASPNGNWSLWAISENNGDGGIISNGWSLTLSTGVAVENDSDLEVTVTQVPAQATVGTLLTYSVAVTNYGPSAATNVVITDYLPTNAVPSNVCNCGTLANGVLTQTLPSLAVGAGTAFNVAVVPSVLGYLTNVVTALSLPLNPNPGANNTNINVNLVISPSADVGIALTASNNPAVIGDSVAFSVAVTNGGPSVALNVDAILVLPAGVVVVANGITATAGTATNTGTNITWTIGSLAYPLSGLAPTLTVMTKATAAGTGLCSASVSSTVYDPFKANDFAAVEVQVGQPLLSIGKNVGTYQVSWSPSATNFVLEEATNLLQTVWTPVPLSNGQYIYPLPLTNNAQYFHLRKLQP